MAKRRGNKKIRKSPPPRKKRKRPPARKSRKKIKAPREPRRRKKPGPKRAGGRKRPKKSKPEPRKRGPKKQPKRPGRGPKKQPRKPPRRKKPTKSPRIGGPVRVRKRSPQDVRELISAHFAKWAADAGATYPAGRTGPRFTFQVLSWVNSDESVSVELRFDDINRKLSIDQLLLTLGASAAGTAVNGAWLSVGFRFPSRGAEPDSEEGYKRLTGLILFRTHTRRWTRLLVPLIFLQAREGHEAYLRRYKRRAVSIFVRAWWNATGKRPSKRR